MKTQNFKQTEIGKSILINPKRNLKKATTAKKVSMNKLNPFVKQVQGFEITEFKGGSKFVNGDTLLARITPCLENGKTAYVDFLDRGEIGFGSTEFIVLSGKEGVTINEFVYYLSISPNFRNQAISSMTGTSGRQRIQNDFLSKKKIKIPSLSEQSAIAKILSDLDSKIELLQKQNETLEKMGQAIFKHWFVDFDFPNEEDKPYKSSGGKMIESELGEIPEGWSVGKLGDFVDVQRGLSYKGKFLSENEKDIPMINLGTIAPHKGYRKEGIKYYTGDHKERHLVKPGDIVMANTDITQKRDVLGSPAIVPDFGSEEILFTHHIYAVRNEKFPELFLYYLFQNNSYKERAITFATGTTVLALPKEAILEYEFVVPQEDIFNQFGKFAKDIFNKIILNTKSIKSLEKTRDLLLPKLMTGKIRVPLEDVK